MLGGGARHRAVADIARMRHVEGGGADRRWNGNAWGNNFNISNILRQRDGGSCERLLCCQATESQLQLLPSDGFSSSLSSVLTAFDLMPFPMGGFVFIFVVVR